MIKYLIGTDVRGHIGQPDTFGHNYSLPGYFSSVSALFLLFLYHIFWVFMRFYSSLSFF